MEKRLYRSQKDRMIWGVCGGLAHYFNIDPVVVRLIFVLTTIFWGFGLIVYIILAIVVPLESSTTSQPRETIVENVQEMKETAQNLGMGIQANLSHDEGSNAREHLITVVGIVIVLIGVLILLASVFSWFHWWSWAFAGPIILIAVGLLILFARRK